MEQSVTKFWNKNFIMLVIGQIVSLFGNAILRFALPMYVLLTYGSPELMGRVMALAVVPMIVIAPFGGVIADRLNKKRLIVFLDFFTAAGVFIYLWAIGSLSIVPITIIALMMLIAINGMMGPATDSSFPLIVPAEQLVRANSITMAINTLAMMVGPPLGGILLAEFGLNSLLIVGGISFALAATMEVFIRIPSIKHKSSGSMIRVIVGDLGAGIRFAVKEQTIIAKILLVVIMFSLIVASFGLIALPVLVTQYLNMTSRMAGLAAGILGAGGVAGSILAGILGQKMNIRMNHWPLLIIGICLAPMGLAFFLSTNAIVAFVTLVAVMFCLMGASTVFTVQMLTFIQRITPPELLGKTMALIMTATVLSQPLGQWAYGILFERLMETPWIIIFSVSFLAVIIALWARGYFRSIPAEPMAVVESRP